MRSRSRGIIDFRLRLYWEEFKDIRLPLPSFAEQVRLADELDEMLSAMDGQDQAIAVTAKLLSEQRRAIIHEAVTGASTAKQTLTRAPLAEPELVEL